MASISPKRILNNKTVYVKVKDNKSGIVYEKQSSIKRKKNKTFVSLHRRRKIDSLNWDSPWEVLFFRNGKRIMSVYVFTFKGKAINFVVNFLKRKKL